MNVWCPWNPEKGISSFETGAKDGCGLPYVFWESIPCSLEEQPVL